SRRRHTRFSRDWSSDVCSSDLAVSTITTSWNCRRACATAASAMPTGFWLGSLGKHSTPTSAASVASCSMAAGRYTSALTTSTFLDRKSVVEGKGGRHGGGRDRQ